MAIVPSKNILAVDAIGEAQDLAVVEDAALLLRKIGISLYNIAVSELYTLLGYIDEESYLQGETLSLTGALTSERAASISSWAIDEIIDLEVFHNLTTDRPVQRVGSRDFLKHRRNGTAQHPYDEYYIWTQFGTDVYIMQGESITDDWDDVTAEVWFRRSPTLLTTSNRTTAKIDVPDRYYSILVHRIASLAELRKGITDKALAFVKQSYYQLLQSVEPSERTKLLDSFIGMSE